MPALPCPDSDVHIMFILIDELDAFYLITHYRPVDIFSEEDITAAAEYE